MKLAVTKKEPLTFAVECERLWTVNLHPIEGERGRFKGISETRFRCITEPCRHLFNRSVKSQLEHGETRPEHVKCPRCGGDTEPVEYMVNVLEPHGHPRCTCESYTTHKGELECKHGSAALYLFGKLEASASAEKHVQGP